MYMYLSQVSAFTSGRRAQIASSQWNELKKNIHNKATAGQIYALIYNALCYFANNLQMSIDYLISYQPWKCGNVEMWKSLLTT